MQTIAIYNFKGGSFKSTATHTLATGLAIRGKRVLVVDTDPQAHASILLGVTPQPGLYDLLVRDARWNDVLQQAPTANYTSKHVNGLIAVLPGDDETASIANSKKITSPAKLRKRLQQIKDHFDLCLIDTSPTPSLMSSIIYLAADSVLYPTKPEALHFDGLQRAIATKHEIDEIRQEG